MKAAVAIGIAVALLGAVAAADAPRRPRRRAPAPSSSSAPARGFVALKTPAPERVLIRGGTFMMGSSDEEIELARTLCKREPLGEDGRCRDDARADDGEPAFSDETSAHEVAVGDFWMDRTEVTNARYRRCVAAGRCALPPYSAGAARLDRPELPVVLVNWPEAVAFCEWAGGRLPTEAEWERAARGLSGRRFPWGNVYNPFLANHGQLATDKHDGSDGFFELAPVGSFPDGRTPEGLEDMAGNVWEWTSDWYAKEYPRVSAVNPKGPDEGDLRVLRGGSYESPGVRVRSSARNAAFPGMRETYIGFRCAR